MKESEAKLLEIKSKARKGFFMKGHTFFQLKKEWESFALLKLKEAFVEVGLILEDEKLTHPIKQINNNDITNETIPHLRRNHDVLSCLPAFSNGPDIISLKRLSS